MPKRYSKYQKLQKKYATRTKTLFTDAKGRAILQSISRGKNAYLRLDRFESAFMDTTWIKRVEDCIPQLEEIVNNPRRVIATVAEVEAVEKAKKTTSESVMHLASHTQFVKEVKDNGEVIPNKILNISNEDYFIIYENKFIATLIRHLLSFVEKRYQYIVNFAPLKDSEVLYVKSLSTIDGYEAEIETKVRLTRPTSDDFSEKAKVFLRRIEEMRKHLRFFANSEFMRLLRNERDVRNPILQTNIIRKNPLYRKCYHLWVFLDNYIKSGLNVRVEERISDLSKRELTELNELMFANFIALKGKDPAKKVLKGRVKTYVPKILNTLDDDVFIFGPYYDGPLEFIRVDQQYRDFLNHPYDVDAHPTKAIAEYDKDKYQANRFIRERGKEMDALIRRRNAEAKAYLKSTQELLEKQKEDALKAKKKAEAKAREEELKRLEQAREALMNVARTDEFNLPEEYIKETRRKEKQIFTKTIAIPMDEETTPETLSMDERPEETTYLGEASMKLEQTIEVITTKGKTKDIKKTVKPPVKKKAKKGVSL